MKHKRHERERYMDQRKQNGCRSPEELFGGQAAGHDTWGTPVIYVSDDGIPLRDPVDRDQAECAE